MPNSNTESRPVALAPQAAFDLLAVNPQAYLIDIRTTVEHLLVGHPVGAIHIAWLDEPDWTPNPRFVSQVREILLGGLLESGEENPPGIILICRSGRRSRQAGAVLLEAGIPNVHYIDGGFEGPLDDQHHRSTRAGWRYTALPWIQC